MADNYHQECRWQDLPYVLHPQPADVLFVSRGPRALSAPPSISTTRARDCQNGTDEEPGNKSWTSKIESPAGAEKESFSRFCHPNFEIIARNIPEDKIQELKHILMAFTSSLEIERRMLPHVPDKCRIYSCDVTENEISHHNVTLPQHISKVIDTEAPCNQYTEYCRDLRHKTLPLFTATTPPAYAHLGRATNRGSLQDLAPDTESVLPLTEITCNMTSQRLESQKDNHESDSGSSIDFLHLARQTDSDAVRLLEDEYDRMMTDAD